jgi:2',3'-cyclic-nucleotide 2'-phosphodiesterase
MLGRMLKVLFIGDIVGRCGRECLMACLPAWRESHGVDLVIANGENAAGGAGINARLANELRAHGVDAITLGDHVWDQRGFETEIGALERVCRPANLPEQCPGRTYLILQHEGFRLAVFTLLGRNFMKVEADSPFSVADRLMRQLKGQADAFIVEIHAETTSEKVAFGWYLDGRAAAVLGTHTHVPTADARILPRGTAYITDVGMTGPRYSVIGRQIQPVIARFLDGMPRKFEIATEDPMLCGCLLEIDKDGFATKFERVEMRPEMTE